MAQSAQQTLRRLTLIVALQWMGATLALPLLPLFLEHRGASATMVGVVMSSFFVAGVATQFALGHVADRFGRRRVLVGALVVYGVASMVFLLPVSALWFMIARALQGASAGAFEVTSLSAVAALFAEEQRGRAMSRIFAAQIFGLALGPMVGSLASVNDLGLAYLATGVISLGASVVAWRTSLGNEHVTSEPLPKLQWNRQITGTLFAASSLGLIIGVYEACWSLLMHAHGASSLQIRLSWTLFGIPMATLSRFGGWLADHANRRLVALGGLLSGASFLSIYPHVHNNVVILFIGSIEAIGASLSAPSISSLLSQGAHQRELSRRQGLYTTANTASLALAAGFSGALFSINTALPFTLVAVLSGLLALTTLWWWRDVRGRVQKEVP
ncbi:MAG TPA: MFS transporter [Acidimicrobiales bacterium]|jgi:DHA1 family multidrug resistance protein-like MFS transporter